MTTVKIDAIFDSVTGWNEESVMNSFVIHSDVPVTPVELLDMKNAIANFYNGLATGQGVALASYIASTVDRSTNGVTLKSYDITNSLDGSPYGSPFDVDSFTLGSSGTQTLFPTQACAVVTLRGRDALSQPVEGPADSRPRQRRTGRLFIGPLNASAGSTASNTIQRVSSNFRTNVCAAAEGLQDQLVDGDYAWAVWSRATASVHVITRAECDDSFDTLRSRKLRPTVRTTRTFAPIPALVLGA